MKVSDTFFGKFYLQYKIGKSSKANLDFGQLLNSVLMCYRTSNY